MNAAQRRRQRRALARGWPKGTVAEYCGARVRVEGPNKMWPTAINIIGIERGKRMTVSSHHLTRVPTMVFTSGHKDALRADLGDRRFMVVPS